MDDLLATLQGAGPQPPQGAAPAAPAPANPNAQGGFDPTKSYGTPTKLLDNLNHTESSGNQFAVNDKTGAMGPYQFTPQTVAMLRKQGVNFDPFDPQQSRAAADYYLQQLKQQNGGTYQGALKAYGGFTTKDPSQYVSKVMSGVQDQSAAPAPTIPGQSSSGQQQPADNGPMSDLFATLQAGPQKPAQAPAAPTPNPNAPAPEESPLSTLGHSAAGLADTILGAPGALLQQGDYAVRRALGSSPEQAAQDSSNYFGGSTHPVGNLFGVTGTPGYQGEPTQRLANLAGEKIGQGVNAVASATGMAPQDVASAAGSLSLLVPGAAKAVGRFAGDAAAATAVDELGAQVNARAPRGATAAPTGPAMQPRTVVGGGAASANLNPYPQFTGEETARGQFPQVKTSKIAQDVTPEEQAVRANVANQIMGENAGSVRTGVITGNENTLRDENASANSPMQTPASQAMKAQLVNEQNALSQYAEDRVNATGASQSVSGNEERGRIINDAIYGPEDSLTSYLQDAKRTIYDTARETQGDNPIQSQHVDNLFADPQFQAGVRLRGNEAALSGAQDLINLARTTGFRDPVTGEMYPPGSVAAWDAVRKSLNSNWSPSNAGTIRAINGAIDQDTAAAGGNEMYKLGDRIHQVERTLLDSRGIGSVLGEYDANGVKTGASLESIPAKLNTMPIDQWQHIRDTLDDLSRGQVRGAPEGMPAVPTEVMQSAAAARAEMDGALARSVYEAGASKAGVWNQNSANKVLNSVVGQKITRNFPPDEVGRFHTLNYGGQMMPGVHSYEGAGQQLSRLARPGFVEKYAPNAGASAGATIGSSIPIPGATWAGAAIGERVGTRLSNLAGGRRTAQQLRSVTEEMQRNSRLGNQ